MPNTESGEYGIEPLSEIKGASNRFRVTSTPVTSDAGRPESFIISSGTANEGDDLGGGIKADRFSYRVSITEASDRLKAALREQVEWYNKRYNDASPAEKLFHEVQLAHCPDGSVILAGNSVHTIASRITNCTADKRPLLSQRGDYLPLSQVLSRDLQQAGLDAVTSYPIMQPVPSYILTMENGSKFRVSCSVVRAGETIGDVTAKDTFAKLTITECDAQLADGIKQESWRRNERLGRRPKDTLYVFDVRNDPHSVVLVGDLSAIADCLEKSGVGRQQTMAAHFGKIFNGLGVSPQGAAHGKD